MKKEDEMSNKLNGLGYREFQPTSELLPFVQCYWALVVSAKNSGLTHQVLPDGCMDILFDLRSGSTEVVGTMTRSLEFPLDGETTLFGVRFKPGAATHFIDFVANEITDNSVPTNLIDKVFADDLSPHLMKCQTNNERVGILNGRVPKLVEI